ncbi:MAG: LacI family DNA-binding transcriptional regulator [Jatrophihabitantaceae bacterium]
MAQSAGVSISTVSHVINGTRVVEPATVQRVNDAIVRTGYRHNRLASALARGVGTQSVGVALSSQSNPYLADLVMPIEASLTRHGSLMLLGETHEDADSELRLVNALLDRRVDGIILAPSPRSAEQTLPVLAKSGLPVVLLDRIADARHFDQVGSDNVEPMASTVDHLAGHGHTRIALIAGMAGLSTSLERQEGYLRGMQRNGLDMAPGLIVDGGSSAAEAGRAMERLWSRDPRPTAVIPANNYMTVGVLKWLRQARLVVPRDVALAGFDDFEWSDLIDPPLTAVAQNWTTIGQRAIEMLTERMAKPDRPFRTERIVASLMVRQSCGCPAEDSAAAG